jgi:hypothetical protein
MRDRILILAGVLLVVTGIFMAPALGRNVQKDRSQGLKKAAAQSVVATYFDINNVSTVFRNDGISDIDIQQQNSGFVFPKGSRKTCVFQSGFLWGGSVGGQVRVGGVAYRTGLQPGKILSPGVAEDPNLDSRRIYRIRPDISPYLSADQLKVVDVTSEVNDQGQGKDAIIAQYQADWAEWPAADGAPYVDVNHNGVYDPTVDIPGVQGADQTIWYVTNDLNSGNTTNLYGSNPIGIELQVTVWGYNQSGALGDMLFRRYVIINKGARPAGADTITNMYVSQWSDIDDGNATDDFAGCDTTLSLGYVYNANAVDATYNPLPPPAVGFDFFQGPIVSSLGDSAIFHGQRIYGKKNLPMTAYYYFARGDATVTDPVQGSYEGTTQFYNFFQGKIGKTGDFFNDPHTNLPTTFALPGDPVTGTGWLDGDLLPAGDRRVGMASGPFTMAPGDTQEVVVAEIAAGAILGVDRLTAVSLLKYYDKQAQNAYDQFFNITPPPPAPVINVVEEDKSITLSWGDNLSGVKNTEGYNINGYTFEGYNVYQLPSASAGKDQAKLLATYDLADGVTTVYDTDFDPATGGFVTKPIQYGNDKGIIRYLTIETDALKGGTPLINGIRYYFAVTAWGFNPADHLFELGLPRTKENPIGSSIIKTAVPHSINPGMVYAGNTGNEVSVTHTTGVGDGSVHPIIIDPKKLTGKDYKVTFSTSEGGALLWNLFRGNGTGFDTLLLNRTDLTGADTNAIIDGMLIKTLAPPDGMKDYSIPSGARRWTWVNADTYAGVNPDGLEGFNGAMGLATWWGTSLTPLGAHNVLLKFAATDSAGNLADPNDTLASYAYRYMRGAQGAAAQPSFVPYIINTSASYAYQDFRQGSVPVAAYDLENGGRRMAVGFLENNVTAGLVDGKYWPPASDEAVDNAGTTGPREWLFIFDYPYSTTADPALEKNFNTESDQLPTMWMILACRRGAPSVYFHAGDQFEILANHPNTAADVYNFTAPNPVFDADKAKADIAKINVFPNPYYGVNTEELNKYQRFVTFSHLPQTAKIRIFNLAGVLVRTIDKDDPGQFQRWDLQNDNGLPVGSGLYIAYIDMPGIGNKTVKFSIIQEQQILDRF